MQTANGRDLIMTTRLHLAPRLRMRRATPLLATTCPHDVDSNAFTFLHFVTCIKAPKSNSFKCVHGSVNRAPPTMYPYVTLVMTFNILSIQMTQNLHNRMSSIIPPSPSEELTMKDICFCDMFQNFQMHFQAHAVCVTSFSFTPVIN